MEEETEDEEHGHKHVKGIPWSCAEWHKRRRRMDVALVFMAINIQWMVLYLMYHNEENVIVSQLAITLIGAALSLIVAYVFGAAWDDNNFRKNTVNLAKVTGAKPEIRDATSDS